MSTASQLSTHRKLHDRHRNSRECCNGETWHRPSIRIAMLTPVLTVALRSLNLPNTIAPAVQLAFSVVNDKGPKTKTTYHGPHPGAGAMTTLHHHYLSHHQPSGTSCAIRSTLHGPLGSPATPPEHGAEGFP